MRNIGLTTATIVLSLCLSALAAQAAEPCANMKGSVLTACLKANPPKNASSSAAATQQSAEQAAQARMQGVVSQKGNVDKSKLDQMHNLTKQVK